MSEARSPETLREYFDLLHWKKLGCKVDLTSERLEINDKLKSINQSLNTIQALIPERKLLIEFDEGNLDKIEVEALAINDKLLRIEPEISRVQDSLTVLNERLASIQQPRRPEVSPAPQLKSTGIFNQLLQKLVRDARLTYHSIKQAITENLLTAISFALPVILACIIYFRYEFLFWVILISALSIYVIYVLISISKKNQYALNQHRERADSEWYEQTKQQQELRIKIQQEQQELTSRLYALEQQRLKYTSDKQQLIAHAQELHGQIQTNCNYITLLKITYQQQIEAQQQTIEELVEQECQSKLLRLQHLEDQAQQWLKDDVDRFTKRAMRKANLLPQEHLGEPASLKTEPIHVLIGITERTSPSRLIEDGVDSKSEGKKASELFINPEDFRSEPSYDSRGRKYGVYEFLVIFLCTNFMSYYKCYFNFVRGKAVNEEYCEYLYDSIVSTKIQETSSVNLKDDNQKSIYSKHLLIATKDGRTLRFQIDRSRVVSDLSLSLSRIDEAAIEIRRMLRQRRVDRILTEGLDD